jgi:protein phosphatase-4 regulatory subunit 3
MKVWRDNADKYNLINSSIINLFDFILKENIKRLISHVVTHYRKDLEKIDYVETFQSLISQNTKNEEAEKSTKEASQKSRTLEKESQEEESYFEESDTESDATIPSSAKSPEILDSDVKPEQEKSLQQSKLDEDSESFFKSIAASHKKKEEDEDDDFVFTNSNSNSSSGSSDSSNGSTDRHHHHHPTIKIEIHSSAISNNTLPQRNIQNGSPKKRPQPDDMMVEETSPKKRRLSPDRIITDEDNKNIS